MPRLGDVGLKGGATSLQSVSKKGRGRISLFDAVAGRVTSEGFLPPNPKPSKYRDTISRSTQPIPPEKALFRQRGRAFLDDLDPYWANEKLAENQKLPDSDLLKAVHTYASDFYSRTFGEQAQIDFYSLDETALLCLGVLLEEMADEVLGNTGDLALTEGEAVDTVERDVISTDVPERETSATSAPTESIMDEEDPSPPEPRRSKKRKLKHGAEENRS